MVLICWYFCWPFLLLEIERINEAWHSFPRNIYQTLSSKVAFVKCCKLNFRKFFFNCEMDCGCFSSDKLISIVNIRLNNNWHQSSSSTPMFFKRAKLSVHRLWIEHKPICEKGYSWNSVSLPTITISVCKKEHANMKISSPISPCFGNTCVKMQCFLFPC